MGDGGRQTTMWPVPRCRQCGCPLLPWLRPEQVASALQVSARHVRNLCRRGRLDYRRIGEGDLSPYRVRHESVHEMLDRGGPDPDWWVRFQELEESAG